LGFLKSSVKVVVTKREILFVEGCGKELSSGHRREPACSRFLQGNQAWTKISFRVRAVNIPTQAKSGLEWATRLRSGGREIAVELLRFLAVLEAPFL